MKTGDILVIRGIVGLATAWKLKQARPDSKIGLVEKEQALGKHQTGNNSGVLHSGAYCKPGSAKAQLAVQGLQPIGDRVCEQVLTRLRPPVLS